VNIPNTRVAIPTPSKPRITMHHKVNPGRLVCLPIVSCDASFHFHGVWITRRKSKGLGSTNVEFTSPDSVSVFRFSNWYCRIVQFDTYPHTLRSSYRTEPYLVSTDELYCDVIVTSVMK